MPIYVCSGLKCQYAAREHKSFWLTTESFDLIDQDNVLTGYDIKPHVSRCAVCEVKTKPLIVHSMTQEQPDCPSGFEQLWNGHSFISNLENGGKIHSQDLMSAGSCMQEVIDDPILECDRAGCAQKNDAEGSWLSAIIEDESACSKTSDYISKCSVCMHY